VRPDLQEALQGLQANLRIEKSLNRKPGMVDGLLTASNEASAEEARLLLEYNKLKAMPGDSFEAQLRVLLRDHVKLENWEEAVSVPPYFLCPFLLPLSLHCDAAAAQALSTTKTCVEYRKASVEKVRPLLLLLLLMLLLLLLLLVCLPAKCRVFCCCCWCCRWSRRSSTWLPPKSTSSSALCSTCASDGLSTSSRRSRLF